MYFGSPEQKEFSTLSEAKVPNDFPKYSHYAILVFDCTSVPEGTEHYNTVQYFYTKSINDLNNFVKYLHSKEAYKFVFFQVAGLGKVKTNISISIENQTSPTERGYRQF